MKSLQTELKAWLSRSLITLLTILTHFPLPELSEEGPLKEAVLVEVLEGLYPFPTFVGAQGQPVPVDLRPAIPQPTAS